MNLFPVFHASPSYLGNDVNMHPRVPLNIGDGEPDTKRICVSISIFSAMQAISTRLYGSGLVFVYKTLVSMEDLHLPEQVQDSDITGEMWLLGDACFQLHAVAKIDKVHLTERDELNSFNLSGIIRMSLVDEMQKMVSIRKDVERISPSEVFGVNEALGDDVSMLSVTDINVSVDSINVAVASINTYGDDGILDNLYVEECFRNHGIANLVVEEAVKWAVENHLNKLHAFAYEENAESLSVLRKVGFVLAEHPVVVENIHKSGMDILHLVCDL